MLSVSFVLLVAQMRKEGGLQKPTPNSNLSVKPSESAVFSRHFACFVFHPYVLSLVFALMSRNKGKFFSLRRLPYPAVLRKYASLLLQRERRCTLCTDIGMSEKLLHILWRCPVWEQIARECVAKLVEMEALQALDLFACRPAHNPYRIRRFECSVRSEADKGYFLVTLYTKSADSRICISGLHADRILSTNFMSVFNFPYISCLRNFGANTRWYLQFHVVCDKLFLSIKTSYVFLWLAST